MRRLGYVALVCVGLAALPMRASELGILVDKQAGESENFGFYHYDAVRPSGFGIRGTYTIMDFKAAEIGLSATYHPESRSNLVWNGVNAGRFTNDYLAVGAEVDWKFLVNLHAGIDIRRETLTTGSSLLVPSGSTTYTRPWIKAGIGFSAPTPVVSPFVRLEVAVAATKPNSSNATSNADDFRKSLAPDYQIGLYGGIRF